MLTLYHGETAVCAAKVRLVLAEKNISYDGRLLDLRKGEQFTPEYQKLNPNSVVPTLVHDGAVLIESTVINEYLDEAFPEYPLRPADPMGRARVHLWTKREDTIHNCINTMTAVTIFRAELLKLPKEQREARYERIPDPIRRDKWRRMIDEGIASPLVIEALTQFAKLFRDMEKVLARGPWLAGETFTLADAGLVSFFYRLELLQMAGLWQGHFPAVAGWFERCKARKSFTPAISDFITDAYRDNYRDLAGPHWPDIKREYEKVMAQS